MTPRFSPCPTPFMTITTPVFMSPRPTRALFKCYSGSNFPFSLPYYSLASHEQSTSTSKGTSSTPTCNASSIRRPTCLHAHASRSKHPADAEYAGSSLEEPQQNSIHRTRVLETTHSDTANINGTLQPFKSFR